jgi:hypothetical protein
VPPQMITNLTAWMETKRDADACIKVKMISVQSDRDHSCCTCPENHHRMSFKYVEPILIVVMLKALNKKLFKGYKLPFDGLCCSPNPADLPLVLFS